MLMIYSKAILIRTTLVTWLKQRRGFKVCKYFEEKGFTQDSKGIFKSPLRQVIVIKYLDAEILNDETIV